MESSFAIMPDGLAPILIFAILPVLVFARRLGVIGKRPAYFLGSVALFVFLALFLPWSGVGLVTLKKMKMVLAAAVALLFLLRRLKVQALARLSHPLPTAQTYAPESAELTSVGQFPSNGVHISKHLRPLATAWGEKGGLGERRTNQILIGLAAGSVIVFLNFFSFHGERTFVHLHDVAHYYLGSKYYAEVGHKDLYIAMLRAEAELYDDHFMAIEARDLETYERVHIRRLLAKSDVVKAAFSPSRWSDFQADVAYFREKLGRQYGGVLVDHGFNPTPVWTLVGGSLARWVPAGSGRGILLLTLLDPLLLVLLLSAVGWAYGKRTLMLSLIFFCLTFGSSFAWTGGGFLRYLWIWALVTGMCCLHRKRHAFAGVLLALSALVRIFPVFIVLPIVFMAGTEVVKTRRIPRRLAVLLGSFGATAALLVALTGLLPRGYGHWPEFSRNMSTHVETISPNIVGLTQILAHRVGVQGDVTQEEFEALKDRRQRIWAAQILLVFLPVLAAVMLISSRKRDEEAAMLGLPLIFSGLNLASYYYAFLMLLVIAHRRSPGRLALIFGVEAASYAALFLVEGEGLAYVIRSLLILAQYLILYLRPSVRSKLL